MTKQKRTTYPKFRLVDQNEHSRIERVSFGPRPDECWYEIEVMGIPYGSFPTQFEAECARDAAVSRLLTAAAAREGRHA